MRKLFDYVKEHMAMSAVVLGVAIMLIAGIVMIIVSSGGKDNTKHLSDIVESSAENAADSDGNPIKDDIATNEDTPSSDEPNGDASSGDNPNNPNGDTSDGDSEGGNNPSGSADGTGEGGNNGDDNKPGSDIPGSDKPSGDSSDGDKPSGDSSDSDGGDSSSDDESSGDSDKPSGDESSGDSDKPSDDELSEDSDKPSDDESSGDSDKPSEDDMTEEEKFLTKNKIEYVANSDGTVTITGGSLYGDVVIPATIEGKKTIVGERAFYSYGSVCEVTSLVIKSIEVKSNAFSDCNKLVSVTFSAEVERLGEDAFSDCDNLSSVSFLGNKVTEIPKGLFNRCTKLSSIALPSSITKVNASFVASGNYYTSQAGISKPSESDYKNIVPAFTIYVTSEPSEVWTENTASGYVSYASLLEGMLSTRKANVQVVYK